MPQSGPPSLRSATLPRIRIAKTWLNGAREDAVAGGFWIGIPARSGGTEIFEAVTLFVLCLVLRKPGKKVASAERQNPLVI